MHGCCCSAALVQAYVGLSRADALVDIAEQSEQQRQHILDLTRQRVAAGLDTRLELREAESALPQARVERAQAQAQADVAVHALAMLAGRGADSYARHHSTAARSGCGAAAARATADQSAGAPAGRAGGTAAHRGGGCRPARAAQRPSIPTSACARWRASPSFGLNDLFEAGSRGYGVGPVISLPLFDAGKLRAQYQGREAAHRLRRGRLRRHGTARGAAERRSTHPHRRAHARAHRPAGDAGRCRGRLSHRRGTLPRGSCRLPVGAQRRDPGARRPPPERADQQPIWRSPASTCCSSSAAASIPGPIPIRNLPECPNEYSQSGCIACTHSRPTAGGACGLTVAGPARAARRGRLRVLLVRLARHFETTDDAYVNGDVVQISSQEPGTVLAVHVDDTQLVAADTPLVELDPADAEVAMSNAEAELARSVRQVRGLFAQGRSCRRRSTSASRRSRTAESDLQAAPGTAGRRRDFRRGAVARARQCHRDARRAGRGARAARRRPWPRPRARASTTIRRCWPPRRRCAMPRWRCTEPSWWRRWPGWWPSARCRSASASRRHAAHGGGAAGRCLGRCQFQGSPACAACASASR